MLNPKKSIAAASTAAFVLLSTVAIANAAPERLFVTPSKAVIRIRNVTCPGSAELKIVVWSRMAGMVKVTLRQKGRGDLGTDIVTTTTKKKGLYRGVQTGTVRLTRAVNGARYRIIASDGNSTTKSKWVSIRSCELVT